MCLELTTPLTLIFVYEAGIEEVLNLNAYYCFYPMKAEEELVEIVGFTRPKRITAF